MTEKQTPSSPKVPSFGTDISPTEEMIARGRFGNGSYQTDDATLAIVRAERRRIAIERKEDRRQEYERLIVESLTDIATFQDALIQLGKQTVVEALKPNAEKMDKTDLEIIAKALKASDQVSNRVLGLASRLDDKAVKDDALSYLIDGQESADGE